MACGEHAKAFCFRYVLFCLIFTSNCAAQLNYESFDYDSCPEWLKNYERFHRQNRNSRAAKYLIAIPHDTHGLGDRLRGMMYAARQAAASNRVLLLSWNHPGKITDYFVPSRGINWRIDGTPAEGMQLLRNTSNSEYYLWGVLRNRDVRNFVRKGGYQSSEKRFVVMQDNEHATSPCMGCPDVGSPESPDLVCLFKFLFKPSAQVHSRVRQQLQQLYPGQNLTQGYAAVHLRLGFLKGEATSINRFKGTSAAADTLAGVLRTVSCGLELANRSRIDFATPLLLLTDHVSLRSFAQQQKLAHVVAPKYGSLHIGNAHSVTAEQHFSTFVDLALFAGAKCVIQSDSGYSHMGWLLGGGTKCSMTIEECMASCKKDPDTWLCTRR